MTKALAAFLIGLMLAASAPAAKIMLIVTKVEAGKDVVPAGPPSDTPPPVRVCMYLAYATDAKHAGEDSLCVAEAQIPGASSASILAALRAKAVAIYAAVEGAVIDAADVVVFGGPQ